MDNALRHAMPAVTPRCHRPLPNWDKQLRHRHHAAVMTNDMACPRRARDTLAHDPRHRVIQWTKHARRQRLSTGWLPAIVHNAGALDARRERK